MKALSGSFTGSGVAQNITDLAAAANLVWLKPVGQIAQFWVSAMPAGTSKPATGATALLAANGISQHANGFTVGTDASVNPSGVLVYWLAISDNGAGDISVGSFVGNITDNRDIALPGFSGTPDMAMTLADAAQGVVWRTSTMSGDSSQQFNGGLSANFIQGFGSGTFQVGSSAVVNPSGATVYFLALKNTPGIFKVLSWVGNAVDNRAITGVGLGAGPMTGWIKAADTTIAVARARDVVGDSSGHMDASAAGADRIQQWLSDGPELGTQVRVNGSGVVYHAAFFKDGTTAPAASSAGLGQLARVA